MCVWVRTLTLASAPASSSRMTSLTELYLAAMCSAASPSHSRNTALTAEGDRCDRESFSRCSSPVEKNECCCEMFN